MKRSLLFGCLLWICIAGAAQAGQPPETINYQGVLRDAADNPRTGTFGMVFRFFGEPIVGDEILVDTHPAVFVDNGLFSVHLGEFPTDGTGAGTYAQLSAVFRDSEEVWLQVEVAGEVLLPRIQIVSSAYSLNTRYVRGQEMVTSGPLDLYVDVATGDDANDGLSGAAAKRTIQAAVDAVPLILAHKVSIHIAPGYYFESVVINRPQSGTPYSFEGIGIELLDDLATPDSVNIVGNGTLAVGLQVVSAIVYTRGVRIAEFAEYGVEAVAGSALVMENCRLSDNAEVGARVESFLQLINCRVEDNGRSGIVVESGDLEINDAIFTNNGEHGLSFKHAGGHLENFEASSNTRAGIQLSSNSDVSCRAAVTLLDNGDGGAEVWTGSNLDFSEAATIGGNDRGVDARDNSSVDFRGTEPIFMGNTGGDMFAERHSTIMNYPSAESCIADGDSICLPSPAP